MEQKRLYEPLLFLKSTNVDNLWKKALSGLGLLLISIENLGFFQVVKKGLTLV